MYLQQTDLILIINVHEMRDLRGPNGQISDENGAIRLNQIVEDLCEVNEISYGRCLLILRKYTPPLTDRTAIEDEEGLKTIAGPEEHKWVPQYAR